MRDALNVGGKLFDGGGLLGGSSSDGLELSDIDDERATCSAVSLSCSVAKRSENTVSFMDEASEPSSLPDVQDERNVQIAVGQPLRYAVDLLNGRGDAVRDALLHITMTSTMAAVPRSPMAR